MSKFEKVVTNTVNGIFMKKVSLEKGWTKQESANKVVEFLTCGKNVSIKEFMKNAK